MRSEWKYLYRAIDEKSETIDFYLSHRRNAKAATRFIIKLIKRYKDSYPTVINTDKNPAYLQAIYHLKKDKALPERTKHQRIKYNNNQLESDHGKLKRFNMCKGVFFFCQTLYRAAGCCAKSKNLLLLDLVTEIT